MCSGFEAPHQPCNLGYIKGNGKNIQLAQIDYYWLKLFVVWSVPSGRPLISWSFLINLVVWPFMYWVFICATKVGFIMARIYYSICHHHDLYRDYDILTLIWIRYFFIPTFLDTLLNINMTILTQPSRFSNSWCLSLRESLKLQHICFNIFRNTHFNWFLTRLLIAFGQHVVTCDSFIFQLTFSFGMHVYMKTTDSVDSFVCNIIIW